MDCMDHALACFPLLVLSFLPILFFPFSLARHEPFLDYFISPSTKSRGLINIKNRGGATPTAFGRLAGHIRITARFLMFRIITQIFTPDSRTGTIVLDFSPTLMTPILHILPANEHSMFLCDSTTNLD